MRATESDKNVRESNDASRILLVEDSPTQAFRLALALDEAGFEVEVTHSAEQGFEKLQGAAFDLVLSDLNLPGESGFDLCRRICDASELAEVRVVLLTGQREPTNVLRGLEAGAHGFMTKMREPAQIADELCRLVEVFARQRSQGPDIAVATFRGRDYRISSEKQQIVDILMSFFEEEARLSAELQRANESLHVEVETRLRAEEKALEANTAKSAFLATMSHELRTPLNAIIGYNELVQEDVELLVESEDGSVSKDQVQQDLAKIHRAASHLLAIINDILDLSKVEAGRMELVNESFRLVHLIDDVAETVSPMISANGNGFGVDIDRGVDRIVADRTKLKQVLLNLLSNAAKFTDGGEIHLRVSPDQYDGRQAMRIAVQDTGVGIPNDKLETLFDPFTQADASTTRRYGGTGLGLAICKRFVGLMRGEITAQSRVGEGSTFVVRLPVDASQFGAESTHRGAPTEDASAAPPVEPEPY